MQKIEIGVKIEDDGVSFFGTDEVNKLLKQGLSVVSVEPGEVMVEEVPAEETGEDNGYALAGFNITVTLK